LTARRFAARVAAFALLLAPVAAAAVDDVIRLHFIDVGQGAATLVEFPCAAVLVDAGGERWPKERWKPARYDSTAALMTYLRGFFRQRPALHDSLALLVLTHPHKDHTRGVPAVLAAYRPKAIVHGGLFRGSGVADEKAARDYARANADVVTSWYVLQRTIDRHGLTNRAIDPITCASTGTTDPVIRALWGQVRDRDGDWFADDFMDENNHSVVVRIDYGKASVLFTGDLEHATRPWNDPRRYAAGIERLLEAHAGTDVLDVGVYHVGHHGAGNGTTDALVAAMSPDIAVISAGPPCRRDGFSAWAHGHPRDRTIDRLQAGVRGSRPAKTVVVFQGAGTRTERTVTKAIYSTGWDGTVVLEGRPSDGAWRVVRTTGPHACTSGG
jgi:beta-lactamase superfamily II metal-dependent hydrolase